MSTTSAPPSSVNDSAALDDDGKPMRSGTEWTAAAHIITGVIGSGILSLPWCMAKLGWLAGIVALFTFGAITYFTSLLLADCYRQLSPNPNEDVEICESRSSPKRNYTYMQAVRYHLGEYQTKLCAIVQYTNLVGVAIGYTIATSISMVAIARSNCFHSKGHEAPCHGASNRYMLMFGGIQLVLSQIPNFSKLWWLSIVAAVMSFSYAGVGTGLGISKMISNGSVAGSFVLRGPVGLQDVWSIFQALGDIAFAYAFTLILLDIQDTLKSTPSSSSSSNSCDESNKSMKKANLIGVSTTTILYALCGCAGYGTFGSSAPGNLLTGFGFYDPYWLVDIANACVVVHLVGAYQVFIQPFFSFVEASASSLFPHSPFIHRHHQIHIPFSSSSSSPHFSINLFRLIWRSSLVIVVTLVAMVLPFFNDILGVLGAITFWPLTVYFPIAMHLTRSKTPRWSSKWWILQSLSLFCLLVSLVALIGSVQGVVTNLRTYKPDWKI